MAGPVRAQARKFFLAYLGLAVLFGVGIGLFVVLAERPGPKPPPPWSAWRPTADMASSRQAQIANHVAAQYHLPSGRQLVDVLVGGPGTASDPIRAVAVANKANPTASSDFAVVDATHTAMYALCGDGPKCSINEGKATTARAAVLRREALELALYTFEYIDVADSVVTFFPPKKGDNPTFALFFAKSELASQLNHPLRRTLPQVTPPVPGEVTPIEQRTIDSLTTTRVFRYALQREQNGARILVLAPVVG